MNNEALIQKIQKLLSLANSDNEHEAKAAAEKAHDLILKHNLSLQEIQDKNFDYEELKVMDQVRTLKGYRVGILGLLRSHFFVIAYLDTFRHPETKKRVKTVRIVGTPANATIAKYIYDYLDETYPRLWKEFKTRSNAPEKYRNSYHAGLTEGICEALDRNKEKIEQQYGLVVQEDSALKAHVESKAQGTRKHKTNIRDAAAYMAGRVDGNQVKLQRPIATSSVSNGLRLGAGK